MTKSDLLGGGGIHRTPPLRDGSAWLACQSGTNLYSESTRTFGHLSAKKMVPLRIVDAEVQEFVGVIFCCRYADFPIPLTHGLLVHEFEPNIAPRTKRQFPCLCNYCRSTPN